MISILIPIYNFDASNLLKELYEQSELIKEDIEVIVYDDHSELFKDTNEKEARKFRFNYQYLPGNLGRSKIRNTMADSAKFDFILFLDGDIIPKSKKFLQNYIDHIGSNTEVIYGGRIHETDTLNRNKLRWKYGHFIEDKTVEERKNKPCLSLVTNNLLIKKKLFQGVYFDESISSYGHEDTLLAIQLKNRRCSCVHIENPVIHKDIDENEVFLEKTESALNNLKAIKKSHKLTGSDVKILRIYKLIESLRLQRIVNILFNKIENQLRNRLVKKGGSLFLFDIYKLGYFIKINQS